MPSDLSSVIASPDIEHVATGFTFTEGPLWHPDGYLLFNDVREQKSWMVRPGDEAATLLREETGGANGQTLDSQGRVVLCEGGNRRVTRVEADGAISVVADSWLDKRLNAVNDIVQKSDGSLYFTNPEGRLDEDEREIGHSGVYRVGPDGTVTEVCRGMNLPNGIGFSPEENLLYVSNTRPDPKLLVYDLQSDGAATNGRLFADLPVDASGPRIGVPDGLKVDMEGRIYCTSAGGCWVFEADGTHLGVIELPEYPANLAWGGPDRRTAYFTCNTTVYSMRMTTPGTPIP